MEQNNLGRSMIEMMGVLAIVGALSVGGMAGYTKAMHQYKVNKAIEQINVISGQLSTIGASGGNYNGMSGNNGNKVAIKLKAVLPEMNPSGTTLINPFGGEVVISAGKLVKDGDNLAYTIEYNGLDSKACTSLATNDWGSTKNSSFIGVAAGDPGSSAVNELYFKCPGKAYNTTLGATVGCNNGSTVKTPLTISQVSGTVNSAATGGCSACTTNCKIVLKYY